MKSHILRGFSPRLDRPLPALATALARGLAVALAMGLCGAALASPPPPPAPGTFVTCTLNSGAITQIKNSLQKAGIDPSLARIDYIVVYSNDLPNHGQPLAGGETTGPVLCANTSRVTVSNTASDTPIPDPDASTATSVDIIETNQALQVQYDEEGKTKTLVCAAYADVDKCKTVTNK